MATAKNERLINLVICLKSARNFVTAEYLRRNVKGYNDGDQTKDSFKRMLERDKNELRAMGVPVETGADPLGGGEGYRIAPDQYALPDISLDAKEAAAVAAAAAFWHDPEVAVESQTAVLKLRAAGVEVAAPEDLGFGPVAGGRTMGDERVIRELLAAVTDGRAVRFTHTASGQAAQRELEPWGVVSTSGRWYVVGHDRDRAETRTFRISRITEATQIGDAGAVVRPAGVDVKALVTDAVSRGQGRDGGRVRLWLARDRAHDLRRSAIETVEASLGGEPGDEVVVEWSSRSALVRAVLAAGPNAVVLDPPEVRDAVIAALDALTVTAAEASR